jgi:hypothetical protein
MFVPVLEISTRLRKVLTTVWMPMDFFEPVRVIQSEASRLTRHPGSPLSFFLRLLHMRICELLCLSNKTGKSLSSPKQRGKYLRRCLKYRQFDQIFLTITRIIRSLASKKMHWKGSRYVFGRWTVRKSAGALAFLTQVSPFLCTIPFSNCRESTSGRP